MKFDVFEFQLWQFSTLATHTLHEGKTWTTDGNVPSDPAPVFVRSQDCSTLRVPS